MPTRFSMLLCLSVAAGMASATTVHTWKDANGVTHFSDVPPPGAESNPDIASTTIEIDDDFPQAPNAADDYYSIANQWQRIKAERDAAKARRLAREKLRAEERARLATLAAQAQPYPPAYPSYPIYPYGRARGHFGAPYLGPGFGHGGTQRRGHLGRHHDDGRTLIRSSANTRPGSASPRGRFVHRPNVGFNSSARFHVRF